MSVFGFVGLGLMGGSFAKAVRAKILAHDSPQSNDSPEGKIFAVDKNEAALIEAQSSGIIDKGFSPAHADEMLSLCDIVFVCLYPARTIDFLKAHRDSFKRDSIVTDIAGVKTGLVAALPAILRSDVDFIPGHPMAGSEKEGYGASSAHIFEGRNYILMPLPSNKTEHLLFLKNLITALGFKRIIETDCATHDHKIAFTSQLCHVIAGALVDSAEDTNITAFGGGSFEDLTRIAMINAPLWTELFLANKKELLAHISAFEQSLGAIKQMIQHNESQELQNKLCAVREKRIEMAL